MSTFAQNEVKISLAQATNMALSNAEDLKNLKLDYQIQEHKNKEVVGTATHE